MGFSFSKWQGLGNDFILVNAATEHIDNFNESAVAVCDRHFGIGADGLVVLLPSEVADFKMRIFNSDGSEAEMCGNVTRCMARYAYENGLTDKTKITLETAAGLIKPEVLFTDGKIDRVRVDMGEPRLTCGEIPIVGPAQQQAVGMTLEAAGVTYSFTGVSMGNPHCVIFVDDLAAVDVAAVGPLIETHPLFPKKINVEFVQVIDQSTLRMKVWERGAGITLACGTGACATLTAAVLNGKTGRQATVILDGGELLVEWADDNHIFMTGTAVEVFRGQFL